MTANNERADWWKQAVVYQVYPRSFKDANGDGLGDIAGITSKIGYLKDLGVDALWLSPFYPSELADGGYDVIDYRNVDPRLGTMDDFDAMVDAAHGAGMKVMVDIVPNHTSDRHAMFQEALRAGRGSAARDRYIFREGRGEHGELPPNDWLSLFGGSAWERVDDGQWYLHIFAVQQPDLNWRNPEVHEEFNATFRFWSDHGTDGFRIDVAHGLAKDFHGASLEELGRRYPVHQVMNHDGMHPLWDRDEVHEIYHEWRKVFNEYQPPRFAVGEAWVVPEHQYRYASQDELGQVFNFEFAKADWTADAFRTAIEEGLESAQETHGSTTTWVMNNHDVPRSASRYGLPQVAAANYHQLAKDWILRDGTTYTEDRDLGERRARAAILMEAGLPGSMYVYQGEELGLFEVPDIPWNRLEDPTARFTRGGFTEKGRDGCRVPLPWDAADAPEPADWNAHFGHGASFGFSPARRTGDGAPAAEPHLPQPLWYGRYAVNVEDRDPDSMLGLYRTVLGLRASLFGSADDAVCRMVEAGPDVIAYTRTVADDAKNPGSRLVSMTNFGGTPVEVPGGEVVLSSVPLQDGRLPQDATAWVLVRR